MNTQAVQVDVGSQTWERAAERLSIADLDDQLRRWLQEGELPGTAAIKGTDWPLAERVEFLKLLSGEQK